MLDVLLQQRHLRVEPLVLGVHGLQLAEQRLDLLVLLEGFQHEILRFSLGGLLRGRIEDLLLDRGMHVQL